MSRLSDAERLAKLKQRKAALQKKLQGVTSKERSMKWKQDRQRKIIMGALVHDGMAARDDVLTKAEAETLRRLVVKLVKAWSSDGARLNELPLFSDLLAT